MTRVVKDDKFIPVTLLKVPALKVVGFKTIEKDGYEAMIVGVVKTETELAE
jgi:large subunit ribosomal protein L3